MCLDTDSIQKLHDASSRLTDLHKQRAAWRALFSDDPIPHPPTQAPLALSHDEGERIFHGRISAVESELEELGWRRTIRVDSRQTADAETA